MVASEDCGLVMPGVLSEWRSHHVKDFGGQFDFHPFFPLAREKLQCVTVLWRLTFFHWLLRCLTDRTLHRDNKD